EGGEGFVKLEPVDLRPALRELLEEVASLLRTWIDGGAAVEAPPLLLGGALGACKLGLDGADATGRLGMHRRDESRDKVREVWVVSRTLHLNMGFVGNHGGRKVERWSPGREHWQDVREDLADYERSAPGGRDRCFVLEVGAAVEGDPHLAFGRHRHRPQVCLAGASRAVPAKPV